MTGGDYADLIEDIFDGTILDIYDAWDAAEQHRWVAVINACKALETKLRDVARMAEQARVSGE